MLLIATINGFTIDEVGVDDGPELTGSQALAPDDLQQIANVARDYIASLPAAALADPDERFDLLIDIFVDGLSRRAAQP